MQLKLSPTGEALSYGNSRQSLHSAPAHCCLHQKTMTPLRLFPAGFVASKVPENLDAVIIGSGVGGLGLAVLLAKVGKKVLVLEQHDRAGGCCHTFKEKGFEFDVGETLNLPW